VTAKLSPEAHASILLMVAAKTRAEARKEWRQARAHPNEKTLRSAFRTCVLASRCSHRAAKAWAHDAPIAHRLIADAKKLDVAAAEFKDRLITATIDAEQ
jgi:hypothetical protein